jgi:two-component system cell cycle sensor histidine kinase/response regulator CckA
MSAAGTVYLKKTIRDLQQRLNEAEETLRCFRAGEVDAIVTSGPQGTCIHTIAGADAPYRVMVEAMGEGALTVTRDGLILFSNERFALILGKPLTQVIGTNLNDLLIPDDAPKLSALLTSRTSARSELRLKRESQPGVVPAVFSANTLFLDDTECVCLVVMDLTDFRNTENELHRSQDMFRLIIDTLPLSLYWKGSDGTFLGCNSQFLADCGVSSQEGLAGLEEQDMPWSDQAGSFESYERKITLNGCQKVAFEATRRVADGTSILTACIRVPLCQEAGGVAGVLGIYQDITTQRSNENHLLQVQKMESIGRLAGGVAHDFNNLLMVINGYGDMLLAALNEGDPLRPWVASIREASGFATQLTAQLLAFSRKQPILPKLLNVGPWVSNSSGLLRRLLGEDVEISIEEPLSSGIVLADTNQLQQVLINLAVNARDAMPLGGRLTIRTENVEVGRNSVAFGDGSLFGHYVLLTVIDTGGGMSEDTRSQLFEPFFTTKPPGQGTGLGLSTVYGIVKQLGGEVWVSSTSEGGSTFEVYLPRVESPAKEATPKESFQWSSVGTETVLVVDDQRSIRDLVVRYLTDFGYKIIAAPGPKDALAAAQSHSGQIHLLITDVVMKGGNGKHLYDELKLSRPGTKVLFMSGYTSDVISRNGVIDSDLNFISKPFGRIELADKVRDVLRGTALSVEE